MLVGTRKAVSLVSLAFFLAGANACTVQQGADVGDTMAETNGAQVFADVDGVLHFASHEAFFETITAVGNMSEADLNAWERSLGFVSYRQSFELAMAEVGTATSEAHAEAILKQHEDIVEIDGDDINPRIQALGYSAVVNREGLFYVAGVLHKVLPEVVISTEDGRIETIQQTLNDMGELGLKLVTAMSTPSAGVRVVRYAGDSLAPLKASNLGCTDNKTAWWNSSDRKVDFKIWTWKYYCAGCCGNYYHQVRAEAKLWGYKKNWLGNWASYKTAYECQNVEAVILAPDLQGTSTTQFTYVPFTLQQTAWKTSNADYESWTCAAWNVGDMIENSNINEPYLTKVKGQGKSRGTGTGNWAEICCGYVGGCSFPAQCIPRTSCYSGECGIIGDGCGGSLDCGTCPIVQCAGNEDLCDDGRCCPAGKCGSSVCLPL